MLSHTPLLALTVIAFVPARGVYLSGEPDGADWHGLGLDSGQASVNLGEFLEAHGLSYRCESVGVEAWTGTSEESIARQVRRALKLAHSVGAAKVQLPPVGPGTPSAARAYSPELEVADKLTARRSGSPFQRRLLFSEQDVLDDGHMTHRSGMSIARQIMRGSLKLRGGVVIVEDFNGNMGNRLHSIGAAITFATYVGAKKLRIQDKFGSEDLFDIPYRTPIDLPGVRNETLRKWCEPVIHSRRLAKSPNNWWFMHCKGVPISHYRDALFNVIRPYMTRDLASCVDFPTNSADKKTLTVHYRSSDKFTVDARVTFPCSLVDYIVKEHFYESVQIVTGPYDDHPCVEHHRRHSQVPVTVQMSTLLEDACAMLRAPHLLVDWSTLPESLALLSVHIQKLHHSGSFTPYLRDGPTWCTDSRQKVWKGTSLFEYNFTTLARKHNGDFVLEGNQVLDYPTKYIKKLRTKKCEDL